MYSMGTSTRAGGGKGRGTKANAFIVRWDRRLEGTEKGPVLVREHGGVLGPAYREVWDRRGRLPCLLASDGGLLSAGDMFQLFSGVLMRIRLSAVPQCYAPDMEASFRV